MSGNGVFGSSPVIAEDGTIYVAHDALFAFSSTGNLLWYYRFGWWDHSSPVIGSDGTIYVAGDGYLYAFSPAGAPKWRRGVLDANIGSPSLGLDGSIYISHVGFGLDAYSPEGNLNWSFRTDESFNYGSSSIAYTSVGSAGTVYFTGMGQETSQLYALNPNGSLKWKAPIESVVELGV